MRASVLVCLMGLLMEMPAQPAFAAAALLDVSLNGRDSGVVMMVSREGDHLFVTADDFRKLNLALPVAAARADLAHLPGLTAHVDEAGQRLLLTAAAAALPRQLYDLNASAADPAPQSDTGAMLHYDLSARTRTPAISGAASAAAAPLRSTSLRPPCAWPIPAS